jgi:hypothetical protein
MDSPDSKPRSPLRRALPWIGVGALVVVVLIVGPFLPGPEPDSGARVCRSHAIGPIGGALTGPPGPWPVNWQELLDRPNSAQLGMEGAAVLRAPDDPATGDPLSDPSFVLVTGLDRDMPPQLVACYERACFHVESVRGSTKYAVLHFVTLGGEVEAFALQITTGTTEAAARAAVERSMQRLIALDQAAIELTRLRQPLAAGDAATTTAWRTALSHPQNHRLRLCAAWVAGASTNRALVPALQRALRAEREQQVREELARSLAMLGDRAGLAVLLGTFEAPVRLQRTQSGEPASDQERRSRAHDGLVALAGENHGGLFDAAAVAAWKAWAR